MNEKNQQRMIWGIWFIHSSLLFTGSLTFQMLISFNVLDEWGIIEGCRRSAILVVVTWILAGILVYVNKKKYSSFPAEPEEHRNEIFSIVIRKPIQSAGKLIIEVVPLLVQSPLLEIREEGRLLLFSSLLPQWTFGELVQVRLEAINADTTWLTVTGRHLFRAKKKGYGQTGASVRKIKKMLRLWKANLKL